MKKYRTANSTKDMLPKRLTFSEKLINSRLKKRGLLPEFVEEEKTKRETKPKKTKYPKRLKDNLPKGTKPQAPKKKKPTIKKIAKRTRRFKGIKMS